MTRPTASRSSAAAVTKRDEVVAVQMPALALVAEHAMAGGELDASCGGDHRVLLDVAR